MGWQPLPDRHRQPRKVGESLDRVAGALGAGRAVALTTVFSAWAEVVGEGVAAHARPRDLRDDVLVVVVDQPAWATQLRFLEAEVLARLGEVVGEGAPRRLEVRVGFPAPAEGADGDDAEGSGEGGGGPGDRLGDRAGRRPRRGASPGRRRPGASA